MLQKGTSEIEDSKSTFSIANKESPVPTNYADLQNNEILCEESFSNISETSTEEFHAKPFAFSEAGNDVALKAWEFIKGTSKVSAMPNSTSVLPLQDPDGLNNVVETFRSPTKVNH